MARWVAGYWINPNPRGADLHKLLLITSHKGSKPSDLRHERLLMNCEKSREGKISYTNLLIETFRLKLRKEYYIDIQTNSDKTGIISWSMAKWGLTA